MAYLLDANVFITAKDSYYGFDFAPAFWDWLVVKNDEGSIYSIEEVREELEVGHDELNGWSRRRDNDFFLPTTDDLFGAVAGITDWVYAQEYTSDAVYNFLERADFYIVAHALALDFAVVTLEKYSNTIHKVKIPNVCNGLNIECIDTFQMLSREQARFVLKGHD